MFRAAVTSIVFQETPLKIAFTVVLLVAAGAAVVLGFVSAPAAAQPARVVPVIVMRALPTVGTRVVPVSPPEPAPVAEAKPTEAPPAPVPAAPTSPVVAEAKVAPVGKPKPKSVPPPEAKPAEARPAPVAVEAGATEPKSAAPKVAPTDAVVPATGGGAPVGILNLRASDTADVFVDGKKVGGSPILGHKVKPGKHKVRFDCYDPSGNARPGVSQTVEVAADGEKDFEFDCPDDG